MNRKYLFLLAVPAVAMICFLVVCPLLLLFRVSLYEPATGRGFYIPGTVSLSNYAAFADKHLIEIICFTVGCGFLVAIVVILISYPLGMFISSLPRRSQSLTLGMILLPKTAGLLAMLFGLQRWLPRGVLATVVTEVYLILPYAVIIIYIQFLSMDPVLQDAACGLGATQWQVFRRVTLPLSLPGTVVAFQFALLWGLGAFLGPLFLGGPAQTTLALEIQRQCFEYGRWPLAATMSIGSLFIALLALIGFPAVTKK